MNRRLILAALVALLLAPTTFARTWMKSLPAAQKIAKEKNQLILVDMFADWCGWCHRFDREVMPSAVFQQATEDIVLLRLDTEDGGEGTAFARKVGITSLPTFVLLAPDLSVAGMIKGYSPPNDFVNILKQVRTNYDQFQNRVRNEAKLDPKQKLELAKDFAARGGADKALPRFTALTTSRNVPPAVRDEAFYELALMYVTQRKYDDALKTIRQLTSISKSGTPVESARVLSGQIYLQQGNLQAAANEYRTFKKAFPNSVLMGHVNQVLPEIERRISASK